MSWALWLGRRGRGGQGEWKMPDGHPGGEGVILVCLFDDQGPLGRVWGEDAHVLRLEMDIPFRSTVVSNRQISVSWFPLLPNSRLSSRVDLWGDHIEIFALLQHWKLRGNVPWTTPFSADHFSSSPDGPIGPWPKR